MNKLRTLIVMAALVISGVAMAQDKPYLTAEDVTIGEDRTGVLKISMVSDEKMMSTNFGLYLPEGIAIDSVYNAKKDKWSKTYEVETDLLDGDFTQSYNEREGYVLCVYFPSGDFTYYAASGVLAEITLKANDTVADGTYEGSLKTIGIANKDAVSVNQGKIPDVTFKIKVGKTTGVKSAVNGADDDALYDLQGRKVTNPQKGGVYVKKGKKVVR